MEILKPIQNKLKKRWTITKGNPLLMLPKISVQNIQPCSFKTIFLDLPIITIELVLQK